MSAFNASNNRMVASSYDAAGNQTVDAQNRTFAYDAENRQITFNGTAGQYFYDGDGRRVKKMDSSGMTVFVYNAMGQLIAEYTNAASSGGGGTSYLTADHLGSTRVVTDSGGNVKARYDMLPYGEEIPAGIGGRTTGMGYSPSQDPTRFKFTGKERDGESGLDYFLARYYSSAQGRFASPDEFGGGPRDVFVLGTGDAEKQALPYAEIATPQSLNKYAYAYNNPFRSLIPMATMSWAMNY
jgi:RHS repeat-associated protein